MGRVGSHFACIIRTCATVRLDEFPGLQDRGEPGVKRLIGRHLVEKAGVDKPRLRGRRAI